jgi:hypothetical protein
MSQTATEPPPPYDPSIIFHHDGPINPVFMTEAIRTLMRTLPLGDSNEPESWANRRMVSATQALAALHPRDEIEAMLGVQAIAAYHAAAAGWRHGMNSAQPRGTGTRYVTAAATAARAFDTMLRALERRQARPLATPAARPAPRAWPKQDNEAAMAALEARCSATGQESETNTGPETDTETDTGDIIELTPEQAAAFKAQVEADMRAEENKGLDLANTEGLRPDGSIVMPEDPTPNQEAYIARRLWIRHCKEWAENRRRGIDREPDIRPLRTGDIIR